MSLIVREAGEDDLEAVAQLLEALHDPPTVVADEEVWKAILAQTNRTVLLAELDGEPAGTADLMMLPNITNGALPRVNVENMAAAVR